jgi:ATP/maltotriose-dependent transcriptional regulator MalT
LIALLERADAGAGQVALVAGEAGSGKSRLARELAHSAERALVLYGSCDPIVDAPYQPFVEALRFLVRVADPQALESCMAGSSAELARLVPAVGSASTDVTADPEAARQRLHAVVVSLLANVSRARPLLFVMDDIHWADGPTLHLLRDVARSAPETRLFLLATHRDRSEDTTAEFSDALASLARTDGIVRLTLRGLSESDVAEYVRASSGVEAGDVAQSIHTLTDGTPFLLSELWRALVDADAVDASSGVLTLTRPLAELGTPQRVREVSRYRLSRLSPETREVLELAAVAGPQFELRLLEEAAPRETLASALEEALASGTIEELPGPRLSYRFSHELVRRALYDHLSALRKAEFHLRVGEGLERVGGSEAELANHFTVAAPIAGGERAIDYNLRAAEAAAVLFAYAQVEEFATAALAYAGERSANWARAQYVLATVEVNLARDGADVRAASAAEAFAALGDVEAAAEAEVLCSRSLRNQRRPEADAAAARALALVRDRPASSAKIGALLAWVGALHVSHGRFREALPYSREALAAAEELGIVPLQVHALLRLGLALGELGEGGIPELERALELGRDGVAPDAMQMAYNNLAALMAARGRQRESARLFAEARVEVERFGLIEGIERVTGMQASFAFNLGQWAQAEEFIEQWLDVVARSPGSRYQNSLISNIRANIARARGDHAGARAHAERCLADSRRAGNFQGTGRALAVLGLVHVERGRPEEADPLVDELLMLVDEQGRALYWRWVIDLACLLYGLGRPEPVPATPHPAWNDPAQAIARGDFVAAAELLVPTDMVTEEAYVRLRAGEQLAGERRYAEARPHLEHAAAFYRSVGGTAYLERALAAGAAKVKT